MLVVWVYLYRDRTAGGTAASGSLFQLIVWVYSHGDRSYCVPTTLGLLEDISIATNSLTGTIPSEIRALPKLFNLELTTEHSNWTVGGTVGAVPLFQLFGLVYSHGDQSAVGSCPIFAGMEPDKELE